MEEVQRRPGVRHRAFKLDVLELRVDLLDQRVGRKTQIATPGAVGCDGGAGPIAREPQDFRLVVLEPFSPPPPLCQFGANFRRMHADFRIPLSLVELDRVVHGYLAKHCVRHYPGIGADAIDRCVLTREWLCECGAIREVSMYDLLQLRVRNAELPASYGRHM